MQQRIGTLRLDDLKQALGKEDNEEERQDLTVAHKVVHIINEVTKTINRCGVESEAFGQVYDSLLHVMSFPRTVDDLAGCSVQLSLSLACFQDPLWASLLMSGVAVM